MKSNSIPLVVTKDKSGKDLNFEEFFKTVDIERIEKYDGKPFTAEHKERMRQSFIKHDGYPSIVEVWPEIFGSNQWINTPFPSLTGTLSIK